MDNWWSDWNSTGPVMIAKVQYLKNLLQQYNVPNKSLFNTEMALICGTTETKMSARRMILI